MLARLYGAIAEPISVLRDAAARAEAAPTPAQHQRWSAHPRLCLGTNVSESSQPREIAQDCVWLFLLHLPAIRTSTRAGRAAPRCRAQTRSSREAQADALCREPGSWAEAPHPSRSPRHNLSMAVPDEQPGNPWRCRGAPVTTSSCTRAAGTQHAGLPLGTAGSRTAVTWAARRHGALGGRSGTVSWHRGGGAHGRGLHPRAALWWGEKGGTGVPSARRTNSPFPRCGACEGVSEAEQF